MALIYQPSKRIFCGWFEPLKSTTYSEYPKIRSVDGEHDVGGLDHRVGLGALEAEGLGGRRRDGGDDAFAGGRFNRHFGGDGAIVDRDDLAFNAVAGGNLQENLL